MEKRFPEIKHKRFLKRVPFIRFRYHKLLILLLSIAGAYYIFSNGQFDGFLESIRSSWYFGTLLAGMMFSFGFTTPFSVGYFLTLNSPNILVHGIIGGFGALISDLLIFHIVRLSFMDEFEMLENTRPMKFLSRIINRSIGKKIMNYLKFSIAGIIIASPLPDELGITMLAGLTKIRSSVLSLISIVMNTIGIMVILWIGS